MAARSSRLRERLPPLSSGCTARSVQNLPEVQKQFGNDGATIVR
jgi:hypothetical protein